MKSARDLIAALFDEQTGVLADRYSSLFSGWRQIAGVDIAAHSAVKDLQNGALLIEVDHPGWVQMIRLKERSILMSIQKRYPELEIRVIKIFTLVNDLNDGGARALADALGVTQAPLSAVTIGASQDGSGWKIRSAAREKLLHSCNRP